jgi:hypothetical protein
MDGIVQSFTNIYQELTHKNKPIFGATNAHGIGGAIMFSKLYSNPSIFQDFQKRMIQRVETDSKSLFLLHNFINPEGFVM